MAMLLDKSPIAIDSGDSFYIENHNTDKTLYFYWDSREYKIAPMRKRLVPFAIICLYFGDPRSRQGQILKYSDSTGTGDIPERMAEVRRLAVRYGVYEQGEADIRASLEHLQLQAKANNELPLHDENFNTRITTDTGDEVIPPLFDHDGSLSTVNFSQGNQRSSDLATTVENLYARIEQLEGERDALDDRGGDNDDDGITFDNPGLVP